MVRLDDNELNINPEVSQQLLGASGLSLSTDPLSLAFGLNDLTLRKVR